MGTRQEEGACQVSYRAGVGSMVKVGNKAEEYDTFLREAWALPLEPIREEGVPSLLDGGARQMWGFRSVEGNEGPSSCLAGGRGENNLWDKVNVRCVACNNSKVLGRRCQEVGWEVVYSSRSMVHHCSPLMESQRGSGTLNRKQRPRHQVVSALRRPELR